MSKSKPPSPLLNQAGGYCRPPADKQFKPGQSGNPKGRPAKKRSKGSGHRHNLDPQDEFMAEMLRPVQVRENDQLVEISAIRAVTRSLNLSALKGDVRAQIHLTKTFEAIRADRDAQSLALFEEAIEIQNWLYEKHKEAESHGTSLADDYPHPSDLLLDPIALEVRINGPVSHDDHRIWDQARNQVADLAGELMTLNAKQHDGPLGAKDLDARRAIQTQIHELNRMIPDIRTLRRLGFDLQRHRKGGAIS